MQEKIIPTPTAAELNDIDRWLNARRAWKRFRDKGTTGSFTAANETLDRYFHYPLEDEEPKDTVETIAMTQAEFDRRIAESTAIGFREGRKMAEDLAYQNGYGEDEEE